MTSIYQHFQIFFSSPGDVAAERAVALEVVEKLNYDPGLSGRMRLDPIAWDNLGTRTPLLAVKTPQQAINENMLRPSDCDIVVVIFWSRMGTPLDVESHGLKPDGTPYLSGTEWEYLDAIHAAKQSENGLPQVLIYRRTEPVLLNPETQDFESQYEQYKRVKAFFDHLAAPTGEFKGGHNQHATPDEFGTLFEHDLRFLIDRLLAISPPPKAKSVLSVEAVSKNGSPFPGLRAFTPKDASYFFGRRRETDSLMRRILENRFVAVVGASGSGKSSLVGAGLIPRLEALDTGRQWLLPQWNTDTKSWGGLRFSPGELGENPFLALASKIAQVVGGTPRKIATELARDSTKITKYFKALLKADNHRETTLVFIDQFEELFTVVDDRYRLGFVKLLKHLVTGHPVRIVVTMRSDFYHRCVDYADLAELLSDGTFPLAAPDQFALLEMIERPAERAELTFDNGLAQQIVHDTGSEPGSLALLAYLLDELYHLRTDDGRLSKTAYDDLEGVQGAIGKRAEITFKKREDGIQRVLPQVFRELVEVNEYGTATNRRALLETFTHDPDARALIDAFTDARLLTTSDGAEGAVVEVAHGALLRSWPRLAKWIESTQDDLRLLRQVRSAAKEWANEGKPTSFLWPDERLRPVYEMAQRLDPQLNEIVKDFIRPEAVRLLEEIGQPETTHQRRSAIGDRLSVIGDPREGVGLNGHGLPHIQWCEVPGGEVWIDNQRFQVRPFYIAKYLISYPQFQVFLEATDGYNNNTWWNGQKIEEMREQRNKYTSYPRDQVNWYQAVAFCRWLDAKHRERNLLPDPIVPAKEETWGIRLPTEWEWQQAATAGNPDNLYPWGTDWGNGQYCNMAEAGLGRATAVGMYPHAISPVGVLDMCGNVWEWCLNESKSLQVSLDSGDIRTLRGGSFFDLREFVNCYARGDHHPHNSSFNYGVRIVYAHM